MDLYKVLNVEKDATIEQIKKSYKLLARKYHPDLHPGKEEQFREITKAYEILSNPDKKAQYDNPKNRWVKLFDLAPNRFNPSLKRSKDVHIVVTANFKEAYYGHYRDIEYKYIDENNQVSERTIFLDVPPVKSGDILTVKGMGSENGDIPGSLIVEFDIEEDIYKVSGLDITYEAEIPFYKFFQKEITIEFLDQELKFELDPIIGAGHVLEVKRKGFRKLNDYRRVGNLYIKLIPKFDVEINEELRRLLENV